MNNAHGRTAMGPRGNAPVIVGRSIPSPRGETPSSHGEKPKSGKWERGPGRAPQTPSGGDRIAEVGV